MRATDVIMNKREGKALSETEIDFLIKGYVDGSIPEYQISAWLMAVYFKGMSFQETGFLTRSMINSGKVFTPGKTGMTMVDKHSTGGVGDKVSLILAPLAAACGVYIPMMSGRALGHTGGTLDKLDSIPGFSTALTEEDFISIIHKGGFAMTGQSKDVVPADRLMYALRDVTATVESIPLITGSIMSKKFAEGSDALIFDVKCGSGAFMKTVEEAEGLATSLVETGKSLGKKIVACLTRMEEPLGFYVGNFLEVQEAIDILKGNKRAKDLIDVTLRLTAWMIVAAGLADSIEEATALCQENIDNGKAYEYFLKNVKLQGGDTKKLEELYNKAPEDRASHTIEVKAEQTGTIQAIDAFATGMAGVTLGVGRNKTTDPVLPHVGLVFNKKCGDSVNAGDTICIIYAEDLKKADSALEMMKEAITINNDSFTKQESMIIKEITAL